MIRLLLYEYRIYFLFLIMFYMIENFVTFECDIPIVEQARDHQNISTSQIRIIFRVG